MRIELQGLLRDAAHLSKLLGAAVSGRLPREIRGIATDSREVRQGDLFVALRGEHKDGLRFCAEAISRGAVAVLGDRDAFLPQSVAFFRASDPVEALLQAAAEWRRSAGAVVVAISGSAGKTTVKEALATVLSHNGDVAYTQGNYNSTLGLPLSVLSFSPCAHWVVEMGVNHVGEMERMSRAAAPDLAVLTSIGSAHIGQFGGMNAVLSEKLKITKGLFAKGSLLLPSAYKGDAMQVYHGRVFGFGDGGDLHLDKIAMTPDGITGDLIAPERVITNLSWPIPGGVGASTLCAVAGAALLLGCEEKRIREGLLLAGAKTPRMRTMHFGERLLIDDTYNASPEAVLGALEVLAVKSAHRPRVAVLGDMLELGVQAPLLHRAVGLALPRYGIAQLFTYGTLSHFIAEGARDAGMPRNTIFSYAPGEEEMLLAALRQKTATNAAVLVKGSGKMKMQALARRLMEG